MLYKEIEGEYYFFSEDSWVHECHLDWFNSYKQEVTNDYYDA